MTTLAGAAPLRVEPGIALLRDVHGEESLSRHRDLFGEPEVLGFDEVMLELDQVSLRGRGGAAFPFATKLATTARSRGRPVVVVNLSEGEPASLKDAALATYRPHLVLDGAVAVARALRAREVHVVVSPHHDRAARAVTRAVAERDHEQVRFVVHRAAPRFVAGQSQAVIELMSGRPNLPVTAWQPAAVKGYRGRPTLLSNGETYAHVALLLSEGHRAFSRRGTAEEPGTTLLTVHDGAVPRVVEVELGTPWQDVLTGSALSRATLLGGYHGTWTPPGLLSNLAVSRHELDRASLTLGAGVVLNTDGCPVQRTTHVVAHLAAESAGRCGPCLNGLPALARALVEVADGRAGTAELHRLCDLVDGRGACAHPDGTARLVRSLLTAYGDEVSSHAAGRCAWRTDTWASQ